MADTKQASESQGVTTLQKDSKGKIDISESVVETIAGIAAREVKGVHDLGKGGFGKVAKALGASSPARGVDVEVGATEVAIDLYLIVSYGFNIPDVCADVRKQVTNRVAQMTGLKVKELNINVVDIQMPDEHQEAPEPRVK